MLTQKNIIVGNALFQRQETVCDESGILIDLATFLEVFLIAVGPKYGIAGVGDGERCAIDLPLWRFGLLKTIECVRLSRREKFIVISFEATED